MRHLISYLLFVGLPLVGLLGVLRVGQGLEAPAAVHGAWSVLPMAASGSACVRHVLSKADSAFGISQSGRQLDGRLGPAGDIALRGTVSGTQIALQGVVPPGVALRHAGCTPGDTLRLTARLDRNGAVRTLAARLRSSVCAECGAVDFTAVSHRTVQRRHD